jgi:hypothetical protein
VEVRGKGFYRALFQDLFIRNKHESIYNEVRDGLKNATIPAQQFDITEYNIIVTK